jgi:hypothetical protein
MSRGNIGCIYKVIGGLCASVRAGEIARDLRQSKATRLIRRGCGDRVLYFREGLTA